MSHHPHTTKRNCEGCGELLPPWEAGLCGDCQEMTDQPIVAVTTGEFRGSLQRNLDGEYGEPYPRATADYRIEYEDAAFDSAVVNEVVR